ncbi:MAG: hypothetical protein WCC10_16685 [Tumebacillaceae bacterium]|jgi:disulfide bond formation protein DsbB
MSVLNRYFFYALAFLVVVGALIAQSYAVFGISLVVAIAVGILTEFFDNKRDEKFKHYNAKHQYKH